MGQQWRRGDLCLSSRSDRWDREQRFRSMIIARSEFIRRQRENHSVLLDVFRCVIPTFSARDLDYQRVHPNSPMSVLSLSAFVFRFRSRCRRRRTDHLWKNGKKNWIVIQAFENPSWRSSNGINGTSSMLTKHHHSEILSLSLSLFVLRVGLDWWKNTLKWFLSFGENYWSIWPSINLSFLSGSALTLMVSFALIVCYSIVIKCIGGRA